MPVQTDPRAERMRMLGKIRTTLQTCGISHESAIIADDAITAVLATPKAKQKVGVELRTAANIDGLIRSMSDAASSSRTHHGDYFRDAITVIEAQRDQLTACEKTVGFLTKEKLGLLAQGHSVVINPPNFIQSDDNIPVHISNLSTPAQPESGLLAEAVKVKPDGYLFELFYTGSERWSGQLFSDHDPSLNLPAEHVRNVVPLYRAALAAPAQPESRAVPDGEPDLERARAWLRTRWCQDHPNEGHVKQLAEYAAYLSALAAPQPVEAQTQEKVVGSSGDAIAKALADAEFHAGKMVQRDAFITTTAGDGKPYVKITFQCLEDVHLFVDGLRGLRAWHDTRAALATASEVEG